MNLNGTDWLVEIDWKNLEKYQKCFGTALMWQKNTCGRAAYLETLQTAIISQSFCCISR